MHKEYEEYTVIKATNYASLEKQLSAFKTNGAPIIIAVLENIIEDAIHQAISLTEAREMGKKPIDKLISLVKAKEINYPDSTVAIVCPTLRPGTEYYDDNVKGWTEDLINATSGGNMKNLAIMETIHTEMQIFENDGTHFTNESGTKYVQQMIMHGKQMPINKPINKPPQKQQRQEIQKIMEVDITNTPNTPNKKPWPSRDTMEERMRKMEE